MNFREWNRRKNNWLRWQKGKWASRLLGKTPFRPYLPDEVHSVLVLRNDNKLGDMLVSSVLFRGLRELFPHGQIDVVAGKDNAILALQNPNIHHVHYASESFDSLFRLGCTLRTRRYDLYLDLDEAPTLSSLMFLKLLAPRWAFGLNRRKYPLYNLTAEVPLNRLHITRRYETVLRQLGKKGPFDSTYSLQIPLASVQAARNFLATLPQAGRLIAIAPQGASRHRSFRKEQIAFLAHTFSKDKIILLGQYSRLREWMQGTSMPNVYLFRSSSHVLDAAALLQEAQVLLTVDTFWVHAACALQKNAVAVYQQGEENLAIWRPNYEGVQVVLCASEPNAQCPEYLAAALAKIIK